MKKTTKLIVIGIEVLVVLIIVIVGFSYYNENNKQDTQLSSDSSTADLYIGEDKVQVSKNMIKVMMNSEGTQMKPIYIPVNELLFGINYHYDNNHQITSIDYFPRPELGNLYKQVGNFNESKKTVFIYPIFTQAAYDQNGFYDYYFKRCDVKCLTIPIPTFIHPSYVTSGKATVILTILNYSYVTDIDVDKNPDILKNYDKIIILHNEYVTKKEFDAITSHPHVVYLYPNALYAEVKTDYEHHTLTLIKGHGYNDPDNGFDWQFDNSQYEYDAQCDNWQFNKIDNGIMLDCWPSYRILYSESLLKTIKKS